MKRSRELGMQTFDQALFDLYETNLVTYEDILRNADSVNDLRLQDQAAQPRAAQRRPRGGHRAPDHRLTANPHSRSAQSRPSSGARSAMKTPFPRGAAFLGLGVMGLPMAGHLARAGTGSPVYNRSAAQRRRLGRRIRRAHARPPARSGAGRRHRLFACVGNDDDLRSVVLGARTALRRHEAGRGLRRHTTASAEVARELFAEAKARGLKFIDAPVWAARPAPERPLTVMCGGDAAAFGHQAGGDGVRGPSPARLPGAGPAREDGQPDRHRRAGAGACRGHAFGQKAGLDMKQVLGVIGKGAAQSWQMDNRGKTMVDDRFDFGFAVDWMRKDLGLVPRGSQAQRRAPAGDGAGRPVLCRRAGAGGNRWTPPA